MIILAVMSSLAIPNFSASLESSRAEEGENILRLLLGAQLHYRIENDRFSNQLSLLDLDITAIMLRHFTNINVQNIDPLASIERTGGGSYRLSINQNGVITCTSMGEPCSIIGY